MRQTGNRQPGTHTHTLRTKINPLYANKCKEESTSASNTCVNTHTLKQATIHNPCSVGCQALSHRNEPQGRHLQCRRSFSPTLLPPPRKSLLHSLTRLQVAASRAVQLKSMGTWRPPLHSLATACWWKVWRGGHHSWPSERINYHLSQGAPRRRRRTGEDNSRWVLSRVPFSDRLPFSLH